MSDEATLAADAAQVAEPIAATPETTAPDPVETQPAAADTAGDTEIPDDKRRNRRSSQERIAQLTRQKHERDEEIARLKALVEKAPKEADFTDYSEYERAKVKHAAREALVEDRTEVARAEEEAISRAVQEDWSERVADFKSRAPDFDAVVFNAAVPITKPMAQALMALDDGPALAYHLGKNPGEAARLASMPPMVAATEMGRLAERLKAPPRRTVSSAPPPVAPVVGGGGPVNKDPSQMSQAEYRAWRMGR